MIWVAEKRIVIDWNIYIEADEQHNECIYKTWLRSSEDLAEFNSDIQGDL